MPEHSNRPADHFLDTWPSPHWASGLHTEHLSERQVFTVETENSRYELTILCGATGDVLVRGGPFFPEETAARLAGSWLDGRLRLPGVYIGFRMEFYAQEQFVITSRVRSIGLVTVLDQPSLPLFS